MDDPTEVLIFLGSKATNGYGPLPIGHAIDKVVRKLVHTAAKADTDDRRLLVSLMSLKHAEVLNAFSERMASLAVRRGDPGLVREGLLASALASRLEDIREIILVLSLHYRSLEKLGESPGEYFAEAVKTGLGNDLFDAEAGLYPERSETDRSIGAMGYFESEDEGGFRYIRNW